MIWHLTSPPIPTPLGWWLVVHHLPSSVFVHHCLFFMVLDLTHSHHLQGQALPILLCWLDSQTTPSGRNNLLICCCIHSANTVFNAFHTVHINLETEISRIMYFHWLLIFCSLHVVIMRMTIDMISDPSQVTLSKFFLHLKWLSRFRIPFRNEALTITWHTTSAQFSRSVVSNSSEIPLTIPHQDSLSITNSLSLPEGHTTYLFLLSVFPPWNISLVKAVLFHAMFPATKTLTGT